MYVFLKAQRMPSPWLFYTSSLLTTVQYQYSCMFSPSGLFSLNDNGSLHCLQWGFGSIHPFLCLSSCHCGNKAQRETCWGPVCEEIFAFLTWQVTTGDVTCPRIWHKRDSIKGPTLTLLETISSPQFDKIVAFMSKWGLRQDWKHDDPRLWIFTSNELYSLVTFCPPLGSISSPGWRRGSVTPRITTIPCPGCQHDIDLGERGISMLFRNVTLESIVERYRQAARAAVAIMCNICKPPQQQEATKSCMDCKASYCNECFKLHHPWSTPKAQHEYVGPTTNFRPKASSSYEIYFFVSFLEGSNCSFL